MAIPNVSMISDIVSKSGSQLLRAPLKGGQHAEIIFDNKAMNVFILDGDKIVGGGGFRTVNRNKYKAEMLNLFGQLGKLGADLQALTQDVAALFLRNVK